MNNERLGLILWFALGVGVQAILLIRRELEGGPWNWLKILPCFGGFFGMLPGRHEYQYDPIIHILISLACFAFIFALFFTHYYQGNIFHNILLVLCALPTAATFCIAFSKYKLNFFWKLFFYSWFLIVIVSIGVFQFSFRHLTIFFVGSPLPWIGPLDCLLTGMAFLYLVVNATYIYELIPIPGKHQTWESRMQEWHELTDLMTQRCNDDQPSYGKLALLLTIQGAWLGLNYYFHLLPSAIVINSLILLPVVLSLGTNTTKEALQCFTQTLSKDI